MNKIMSEIKKIAIQVEILAGYIPNDDNVEEYCWEVYSEEMSNDDFVGVILHMIKDNMR